MKPLRVPRPLIAITAALAVGVSAAIVGTAFAAQPAYVLIAPATEVAPVIQPVAFGGEAPADDLFGVSPATADTEVAVGSDDDGIDEATVALLAELAESDDPGDTGPGSITPYDESAPAGSASGADDGDPCAPRDGSGAEECPDGLRSTVLSLVAPENPFYVIASERPTTAEASSFGLVYCDAAVLAESSLLIGVGTNAPATISFRYWPMDDPGNVLEISLETSAEDRAAWEAGLESATGFSGAWARPQHCFVIPGLEQYQSYGATIEATDILGRTDTYPWGFQLPDDRTRPATRVVPLSDNILFVSAPHIAQQDVEVRAWHVAAGDEATCSDPGPTLLHELQELTTTDVSAEFLAARGYLPAYTKRTAVSYWVPEGSTILVCIRWVNPGRPSWEWGTALRQYEQVLQSPDRTLPVVSLAALSLAGSVAENAVELRGHTREGARCGGWTGPDAATATVELPAELPVVCGASGMFTSRGDVVITTSVAVNDREVSQRSVLPLSREACRGVCDEPETSWYRIPLATMRVGSQMCGSSFGDCEPPTSEVAAGSALLRVDWVQGNVNGRSTWGVGSPAEGAPDRVVADVPQMNTFKALEAAPGERTGTYVMRFNLVTDRPVTYTANLIGSCVGAGMTTEVTGESAGNVVVNFGRACLGADYRAEVTLVDADGNTSFWTQRTGPGMWAYGMATVPRAPTNINVSYSMTRPGTGFITHVSPLEVRVGATTVDDPTTGANCVAGTTLAVNNRIFREVPLGDVVPISVTVAMNNASGSATGDEADCWSSDYDGETMTFTVEVSRNDLMTAEGVTVSSPAGSPYVVSVWVHGA